MKPSIVVALELSLIGDTRKLHEAHEHLSTLSKNSGFCIALMEIVDEQTLDVSLKQAALIQLKNMIEAHWNKKQDSLLLGIEEKNMIKNSLVTAVIRCAKVHELIKLYREIITIIVKHEFREWLPLQQIITCFEKNENLEPAMQCLIAIAGNFQFSIVPKDRSFYNDLILFLFPKVIQTVNRNLHSSELIYLSVKFFWKSIHFDLSKEAKELCLNWMQMLYSVITGYNQYCQSKLEEFLPKNTLEFYYLHSKKWATRIILRFLQKHAKNILYGEQIKQNQQFTRKWHENYGGAFFKAIAEQQKVPTMKKVRYFQFKCLHAWSCQKPYLVKEYVSFFQYQVLPNYIRVTPENEHLSHNNPIEYVLMEEQPSLNFTNLKGAARDLWVTISQIQSYTEKGNYVAGAILTENLNYLFKNLKRGTPLEKQFALYMVCEMKSILLKVNEAKQLFLSIIPQQIIPEFKNPINFLRIRTNEVFIHYGSHVMDANVINKAAEQIFNCLSFDSNPLVRIKAALAFHQLLVHEYMRKFVKPFLKNVLEIYLKLIETYDLQQLVRALESIIEYFTEEISPFAIELFQYLSQLFMKLFEKDLQKSASEEYDYECETQLAASGCIKTMTRIVQSPLSEDIRNKLEENILDMCYCILCQKHIGYSEDILNLLSAHLYYIKLNSAELWFFFQVVVYFLVGIPKPFWGKLEQAPMTEKYKKLLINLRDCQKLECYEQAIPVLRSYIMKASKLPDGQMNNFQSTLLQVLLYLFSEIYKLYGEKSGCRETYLNCSSTLLIYIVEVYRLEFLIPILPIIWSYCKFNLLKSHTASLRAISAELLGVLLWKIPLETIKVLQEDYCLDFGLISMVKYHHHLDERYERRRIILGLLSLFDFDQKPLEVYNRLPILFATLLKLIQSTGREIILKYLDGRGLKVAEVENEWSTNMGDDWNFLSDENVQYRDEDDFWEEPYDIHYTDSVAINELASFQRCMIQLQQKKPDLFHQLINSVSEDKIKSVNNDLTKSIDILKQIN